MKVLHFLDEHFERAICSIFLAAMSVIIVMQVIFRYVLNNSLSWSEELARYLFIWLVEIGIPYGIKMDKHICVDAVYTFMPKKAKKYYALVGYVLFLLFALAVVYYGIQVIGMQAASGQVSPAMHIPMKIVYAAPAVGFSLSAIRLIQRIYLTIKHGVPEGPGAEENEKEA